MNHHNISLNIKPPLKANGEIPVLPKPPEPEYYYEGFFTPFKRVDKNYVPLHERIVSGLVSLFK